MAGFQSVGLIVQLSHITEPTWSAHNYLSISQLIRLAGFRVAMEYGSISGAIDGNGVTKLREI